MTDKATRRKMRKGPPDYKCNLFRNCNNADPINNAWGRGVNSDITRVSPFQWMYEWMKSPCRQQPQIISCRVGWTGSKEQTSQRVCCWYTNMWSKWWFILEMLPVVDRWRQNDCLMLFDILRMERHFALIFAASLRNLRVMILVNNRKKGSSLRRAVESLWALRMMPRMFCIVLLFQTNKFNGWRGDEPGL